MLGEYIGYRHSRVHCASGRNQDLGRIGRPQRNVDKLIHDLVSRAPVNAKVKRPQSGAMRTLAPRGPNCSSDPGQNELRRSSRRIVVEQNQVRATHAVAAPIFSEQIARRQLANA